MRHLKLSLIAAILVLQGCADKKDKPVSKAAPPAEPKTVTEYLDQSKNFYDSSPATYCSARLPLDKVPTDQQVATYRIAQNAKTQGMERFFSFLTLYPDQLNVPDPKTGMPILHTLVERNQVEIMKVMVEENFSVGLATVDSQGRLPLHYVNSLEMAQILWELPILNNPQEPWSSRSVGFMNPDKNGQTPLHRLVLNGNPDAVNFAVEGAIVFTVHRQRTQAQVIVDPHRAAAYRIEVPGAGLDEEVTAAVRVYRPARVLQVLEYAGAGA